MQRPHSDSYGAVVNQAASGKQYTPPHVERRMMRNCLGRVADERPVGKHDAELLPPRAWDKRRYRVLGTRHVEQTGDISSVRNDPALPTAYHPTGSEPEEAIADRKSRLIDCFSKRIESFRGKHPGEIRSRFEQAFHSLHVQRLVAVARARCAASPGLLRRGAQIGIACGTPRVNFLFGCEGTCEH
jgi:hypothetical protein